MPDHARPRSRQGGDLGPAKYFTAQRVNLGSFSALVLIGPLQDKPLIAMVVGNVLAIINNFLLVRKFVYRFHPEVDDPE